MRRIPSWAWIAGVVVVAVLCGGGYGWWSSHSANDSNNTTTSTPPAVEKAPTPEPPPEIAHKAQPLQQIPTPVAPTEVPAVTTANDTWSADLDDILLSDTTENQKTERLLKLVNNLKGDAQVEVSQHLVNFVNDETYPGVALLLTNAATPEAVSTVFMNDLLNRNDNLKLPLLLAIAKQENHPKKSEAHDLLELFLQDNFGNDWTKWENSINNYMKENGIVAADTNATPAPEPAP